MKKFLMLDIMISPWIIRVLYWIAQAGVLVIGLIGLFTGDYDFTLGTGANLVGLLVIILGTALCRLVFELFMVQFKICENTEEIKNTLYYKEME